MKCERLLLRSIESSWTEFALEEEKGKKLSIFPGQREREMKRGMNEKKREVVGEID